MTIKQYIENSKTQKCSQWVDQIHKDGFSEFESQIIQAADLMGKILVDNTATFSASINKKSF